MFRSIQENISIDSLIDRLFIRLSIKNTLSDFQFEIISLIVNNTFSSNFSIKREYLNERIKKIELYREKLNKLRNIPVIIQRTEEWYNSRNNMITASDFAQALNQGKFGTQKQLIIKKAGYTEDTFNNNLPALKWGTMFESVATMIYQKRFNVVVNEFGLLKHPYRDYFGASPDGITENGIMVEIKCPFKRKITGEIPIQYYYQIQGQLDVCDLEECDYFECAFILYDSCEAFLADYSQENERGIILEKNNEYIYFMCYNQEEAILNFNSTLNISYDKIIFFKLDKLNNQRVYRDKTFVNEKLDELKIVWDKIIEYRNNKDLYDSEIIVKKKNPKYLFED